MDEDDIFEFLYVFLALLPLFLGVISCLNLI